MTNHKDEIIERIARYYPIKYQVLGKNVLTNIIDNQLNGRDTKVFSSEKGRNVDIMSVITTIGVAVQIIDFSLRFIESKKTKDEDSPKKKELQEEIQLQLKIDNTVISDYDEVIQKMIDEI